MRPLLEVCVDSIESLEAAYQGGADRIELCSALDVGGLTPSFGLLLYGKELFPKLPIYVMIRPRAGDFHYTENEVKLMQKEIESLKDHCDGFVFGLQNADGTVDVENSKILINAASPLPVTFHRAFDLIPNPFEAVDQIIKLGFKRILTSGQETNALQGIHLISELQKLAEKRIIIMPGSGITASNLKTILSETQVSEFHASASSVFKSKMIKRSEKAKMGNDKEKDEFERKVCDQNKVKQLISIAKNF